MPDTFTGRLSLTKVEINASQNTWGAKLNANADTLDAFAQEYDTEVAALQAQITALQAAAVPIKGIIMFSGVDADVPAGWALCNGANGTPDLRDRFVVGRGTTYAQGATGGAATVALATANLPAHSHGITDPGHTHGVYDPTHSHTGYTDGNGAHTHNVQSGIAPYGVAGGAGGMVQSGSGNNVGVTDSQGTHTHNVQTHASGTGVSIYAGATGISTQNAGSGTAHENRPPYYAVAFIQRLS